ncbi:MAG: NADH-quinone oxidoreductase subunit NuoH [Opitutales bacterium]
MNSPPSEIASRPPSIITTQDRTLGILIAIVLAAVVLLSLVAFALFSLKAPGVLTGALWEALRDPAQAPILLKQGLLDYLKIGWGFSPAMLELVSIQVTISTLLGIFTLLFALTSLIERKVLARIQNRYGPNRVGPCGLFQPIADGIKMLIKEDIVPRGADKIVHLLAPVVMVVPALLVLAILPYGPGLVPVELSVGILFFFALGATTEVSVFMAGWGSNNKYSLLGAMRAIAQMISYELPLILSAVAVVMMAGSLSPAVIVEAQSGYSLGFFPNWFVLTPWGIAGFILFFIATQAESNRSPFDLPEGESELVAGHLTEYSGFKYAIFFLAEYIGLFAISGLSVTLFLGGWHAPLPFLEFIPGYLWFFIKLSGLVLLAIWIRGTVPRIRGDQLMDFAWKFMIPMSFVVIVATAVWHYAGAGFLGWIFASPIIVGPYLLFGRSFSAKYASAGRTYRYSDE